MIGYETEQCEEATATQNYAVCVASLDVAQELEVFLYLVIIARPVHVYQAANLGAQPSRYANRELESLFLRAREMGRVGCGPMGSERITRPNRAGFRSCGIAERDYRVEASIRELVPTLGFLAVHRDFELIHRFDRKIMNKPRRSGPGA